MNGPRTWISPTLLPSHGASRPSSPRIAHVDQRHRHAGHRGAAEALVVAGRLAFLAQYDDRRQRRGLGHAPALHEPDAVLGRSARISASGTAAPPTIERIPRRQLPAPGLLGQRARRRPGSGRARSSARRARASAARAASGRAGRRDAGAGRGRRASMPSITAAVGHAPAVGVEHRRHRQHHVGRVRPQLSAEAADQRVQHGRAMRVDDALRPPRGARRVAHRRPGRSRRGRRRRSASASAPASSAS